MFIDHSILDIFVNDKWATSIRVFPTETDAIGIEAFSSGSTKVRELNAWILDADTSNSGVDQIWADKTTKNKGPVDVYNLMGVKLRSGTDRATATEGLPKGIYIVGGEKTAVR